MPGTLLHVSPIGPGVDNPRLAPLAPLHVRAFRPGLYLAPPEHAAVFVVDEKPQIQALQPTAPVLPAVEGSAWDIGAPLDERGAGLADAQGSAPDQASHDDTGGS